MDQDVANAVPLRPKPHAEVTEVCTKESETLSSGTQNTVTTVEEDQKIWDWTEYLPRTPHIQFFRSINWAATQVGPLDEWPPVLRQAAFQVMADSRPATLYWGEKYVPIYNAAFAPLAGQTHPKLMGSTFKDGFPELWGQISPLFELAATTGVAADVIEAPMTVKRNGYEEECFFTGNFTPIRGVDGKVEGFYNALFEITRQKVWERRTAMLNLISTPDNLNTESVCRHIMQCLETNELDVTMVIMYKVDDKAGPEHAILELAGYTGVPQGHALLVDGQSWGSNEGIIPLCRQCWHHTTPLTVPVDSRFDGIDWRGPAGASKTIAVLPLRIGVGLFGFLIIGTNPRQLDSANTQFIGDLTRVVSSVMAAAVSAEEVKLRQERLERDLVKRDVQIRHLVQHASVGMVHLGVDGSFLWANNYYWEITGLRPGEAQSQQYAFFNCVLPEDVARITAEWMKIAEGDVVSSLEIRLKRLYTPPVGDPLPATVLVYAFPFSEGGEIGSVMATCTDISRQKWAEQWQKRLAEDARDAKRQQEAFIDMVSHEMRNPLSAIFHCADDIISSSQVSQLNNALSPQEYADILSENAAAAKTIETCAKHQKYIIDSVLTLGRIESDMLSFNAGTVKPGALCDSALAMFEAEFRANDILASVVADPSIALHNIDEVCTDASRVTQIFINLLSNAIKFVKSESKREIEVQYGACITSPRSEFPEDVYWAPENKQSEDITESPDFGNGQQVYLTFKLRDTGIGIDAAEQSNIWQRFQQANIKTHVMYGGSGLGLFISKQLCQKQGGEIGVRSTVGEGSTFCFYIRVRRLGENMFPSVEHRPSLLRTISAPSVSPEGPSPRATEPQTRVYVLLVEDNVINQQVLRKQLARAGCVVSVANHGADALDQLRGMTCWKGEELSGTPVDVILMDIQMPIMDGLTATRAIRRLEAEGSITHRVPIIAVTANVREEQVDSALEAGVDEVMQKPFKSTDLVAMMMGQVARARVKQLNEMNSPGFPLAFHTSED